MRAFVRLRRILQTNAALASKLDALESPDLLLRRLHAGTDAVGAALQTLERSAATWTRSRGNSVATISQMI